MALDKLYFGLLGVEGIISGGLFLTLIICLIICPGLPYMLGAVLDGYLVPWRKEFQFYAFLPGNLFLAGGIAMSSATFQSEGFSLEPWTNVSVFICALVFYIALNIGDLKSRYTPGQLRSAMKIYHNSLYFWYGYLAIVCLIAMWLSSTPVIIKIACTIPYLFWAWYMKKDNDMPEVVKAQRFQFAHVESLPIWRNNWRIRRLTATANGYAYV